MTNPPGTTIKGGNRMKFEIAGIEYTVEEVNGLTDAEHFGYINFADSVIRIDANLSEDRKRQTLAHELAHALLYEAGFEDHDEELASRLGRLLHMFLPDNDFGYFRDDVLNAPHLSVSDTGVEIDRVAKKLCKAVESMRQEYRARHGE